MTDQFSICKVCGKPVDAEYINWVKDQGWVCEDCQDAQEKEEQ